MRLKDPDLIATTDTPAQAGSWQSALGVAGLRLLSILVGLAYVKFYTNALAVDQVGAFFYLGTLSYLLNALVFVPVDSYMQSRLSSICKLPKRTLEHLVGVTLLVGLVVCVILCTPFIALNLLSVSDVPLLYGLASLLYLCTSLRNLLNIRGQAIFSAGMIALESTARLLAFIIAVATLGASARTLLMSSIVALAAEFILLLWQAHRSLKISDVEERLDHPAKILRTVATLAGGAASNTVQLQAYRILFPAVGHADTVAALGVTANIGGVAMSACAQVFSQLYLPRLYQSQGASIGQYAGWATAVGLGLLAVALPMSDFLVRHLTHAAYVPYASVIGIGIVIEACNLLIGAYGVYLTIHGRTGTLFRFQLAGAVLSLAGCIWLLALAPNNPLTLGIVVAGSQLLVTSSLAYHVHTIRRKGF